MKRLIYFKKQFFFLLFYPRERKFNHNKRILKVRYFFFLQHQAYIPALINKYDETTKNVNKTQLVAKYITFITALHHITTIDKCFGIAKKCCTQQMGCDE